MAPVIVVKIPSQFFLCMSVDSWPDAHCTEPVTATLSPKVKSHVHIWHLPGLCPLNVNGLRRRQLENNSASKLAEQLAVEWICVLCSSYLVKDVLLVETCI